MKGIYKIGLRVALLLAAVSAGELIYKTYFWRHDLETNEGKVLLSLLNANDSADVVYLAESSNATCDEKDSCTKSICAITADYFPKLVFRPVEKNASHAGIYRLVLEHLKKGGRIKTVIVTLNMRSFDAIWIHSKLETALQRSNLLMRPYPALAGRFLLSLNAYEKISEEEREHMALTQMGKEVLHFPYKFPHKTAVAWDAAMGNGGYLNADGSWDLPKIQLACHYIKTYAFQIDTNTNPRIRDFDKIAEICAQKGVRLVLNLLPENVQYADSLVGKDLVFLMRQNRDLLVTRYQRKGALVVDNLETVQGKDYIDQKWTTEHYNERGRITIAKNLAKKLQAIHNTEFVEVGAQYEKYLARFEQTPDSTAEQRSLQTIEARIRADAGWLQDIQRKAKEKNVSVDEMIKLDARYVYDTDPKSRLK